MESLGDVRRKIKKLEDNAEKADDSGNMDLYNTILKELVLLREKEERLALEERMGSGAGAGASGTLGAGAGEVEGPPWQQLLAKIDGLAAGIKMLISQSRNYRLTASDGGKSSHWQYAEAVLCGRFKMVSTLPPCCFTFNRPSKSNGTISLFVWSPAKDENDTRNVNKVLKFLHDHVLPKGVVAIALQATEWLTASIDCGNTGSLTIANSKTDYAFLLERGHQMLTQLQQQSGDSKDDKVTENMLHLVLPHMIGLFETKTTDSLGTGEGPLHQALLEYLAVNKLRVRASDKIPVFMGDCNQWWCVHAGANDNEIHLMRLQPLPSVPEESAAKVTEEAERYNNTRFVKAIIKKARNDRLQLLQVSTAGGGNGSGGSRGSRSRGDGSGSGSNHGGDSGSSNGGRGDGGGGHGNNGGGENAGESSLSQPCGGGHGAKPQPRSSTCHDDYDGEASSDRSGAPADEGTEEAAWDHSYTQQMYALLQRPEVYQSLGLSGPPTSFTPPDLESYARSMHIVGSSDMHV